MSNVAPAPARPLRSVLDRVRALSRERVHALVICGAVAIHLAHQWAYRKWYLEDAAIVFAYARNLVEGHGLVPWPGAERVEGYSDPLWLALIALGHAVGVEGWTSGKVLAAFFGAGSLVLAWRVARAALDREDDTAALFAPLVLAANAPHAIWSASALENALFNFLLLWGIDRVVAEERRAGFPWSSLIFLMLALTRPDGLLYAALGGFWFLVATWRAGRGLGPSVLWVLAFWVPYAAMVAARVWYFAFHWPNTYFAKVGTHTGNVHQYYSRGWSQIREYCADLWTGWFLPVHVLGLMGTRGWRHRVAWGVIGVVGVALLVPGPHSLRYRWFWPQVAEPYAWLLARIVLLGVVAVVLPLLSIGGRGWLARAMTWSMVVCSVFFSIYSNGDWTRGLRWMSFFAGTSSVLFAVGVDEVLELVKRWGRVPRWGSVGWLVALLLVGLQFPPHLTFSRAYHRHPDDSPFGIRKRVDYTAGFADRVFLDGKIRSLDMDMGAHLWGLRHHMVDVAGLVDIPIALHTYAQRDFVQQYVFDEQQPHFVYCEAHWADATGFKAYPNWEREFFPMPGYVDGKWFHYGVYARRALVMEPAWSGPADRRVAFARGVVLEGWDVPDAVGAGRGMFVEVGFRTEFERGMHDPFHVQLFLSDADGARVVSWDLPMGYGLLPVDEWDTNEVFVGRYALDVPKDLLPGRYDLGFFVTGGKGYGLDAGGVEGAVPPGVVVGGRNGKARVARGEARFPGAITVVSGKDADARASADARRALDEAKAGRCDEAEAAWLLARRRLPGNRKWHAERAPTIDASVARCLARAAQADPSQAVALLARAHQRDADNKVLREVGEPLAQALYDAGKAAMAQEDWASAYRHFSDVLRFAPHWSWARRYAEQSRDHLLGIYDDQGWTWSRLGPY